MFIENGRSSIMTHRLFRVLAPALAAVALSATACTDSAELSVEPSGSSLGPTSPGPRTTDLSSDDIVLTSALETVDSCDALLERIKAEALERVGPYGFNQGGPQPGLLRTGAVDATEAQRPSGTGPAASTAMADASAGASSAAENNASVGGASESSGKEAGIRSGRSEGGTAMGAIVRGR